MRKYFEYKHIVTLEETNVVGNVYFANHIRWQGKVRELFMKQFAPDVVDLFSHISLITTKVSCSYFKELFAFDNIIIRMFVTSLTQNKIDMKFEYFRDKQSYEELVAQGHQQIVCMKKENEILVPEKLPESLFLAVSSFHE
jgi:enediyne biosynthesis thioesterase